jgi:dihydroxyacetone kinase
MNGISLTLLALNNSKDLSQDSLLSLLDAPTIAPAWINSTSPPFVLQQVTVFDISSTETKGNKVRSTLANNFSTNGTQQPMSISLFEIEVTRKICQRIIELEPLLTNYDMICGDGDCGLVLKKGALKIIERVSNEDILDISLAEFCDNIANAISASMGGTSGALLELFFRSMSSFFLLPENNDGTNLLKCWANALLNGVEAIKLYGGADIGMRTMLVFFILITKNQELKTVF